MLSIVQSCLCIFFYLGAVLSLSRDGVSEELFQQEALESSSILGNSLIAASSGSKSINTLILRNLPFRVSDVYFPVSIAMFVSDYFSITGKLRCFQCQLEIVTLFL